MQIWNTWYFFPLQSDYSGPNDTGLYRTNGSLIAMVPRAFSDNVCVEGAGRLTDGRVINVSSNCSTGASCPVGPTQCYRELDASVFPWGEGTHGNALVPLRSLAADRYSLTMPYGSHVYIREFDGLQIPEIDGIGGFVHDGCWRVDDTGGAIHNEHVDLYAGSRAMYHALDRLVPTHTNLTATIDATQCGAIGGAGGSSGPPWGLVLGAALLAGGSYAGWQWYKNRR